MACGNNLKVYSTATSTAHTQTGNECYDDVINHMSLF